MNPLLYEHLRPLIGRYRLRRFFVILAGGWVATAVAGLAIGATEQAIGWDAPGATWIVIGMGVAVGAVALTMALLGRSDAARVVRGLERAYPDLDARLMTAMQQHPAPGRSGLSYLQQSVVRETVYHSFQHSWLGVVPWWHLVATPLGSLLALGALALSISWLSSVTARAGDTAHRFDEVVVPIAPLSVVVEPGDTEVERGSSLLVTAQFETQLPPGAELVITATRGPQRTVRMSKSLSDPVFAARILPVNEPFRYRVRYGATQTRSYQVSVFSYPELRQADAHLEFPAYTQLPPRVVEDVRQLSAVEGSSVKLVCRLNKPVRQAVLRAGDGSAVEMARDSALEGEADAAGTVYSATIIMDQSRRLELLLVDEDGRDNLFPPEFLLTALSNEPPKLKLQRPRRDVQVSPLEELWTEAEAWDDFGLARAGLTYTLSAGEPREIELNASPDPGATVTLRHLLAMEDLGVRPDDVLSYFFWAEDVDAEGRPRRSFSDMYFADVRPFEEIFRQGQAPPSGQSQSSPQGAQNAQRAGELADVQKQIINALWNLIRRETAAAVSPPFVDDVKTTQESQLALREQLSEMVEQLASAASSRPASEALSAMQQAADHMQQAWQGATAESLQPALREATRAYQALLRLRAHEHQVVRGNPQQRSRQGGGNRAQQQMQQLELRDDENRYESQSVAQPAETAADREDRQILSRLRELARRQNDLNDRIKELQSALQEAQSPEEREEIERQLQRLREEQQEILRDTDALRERMNQNDNRQRTTEQAQQLDRARENVRRSSEALRRGQVSRAAAQGQRAAEQLRELRDDFQNRASGQFGEAMRQMREQARELDQAQQELGEQLDRQNRPETQTPSLRPDDPAGELPEALQRQKERLENLRQNMRETIDQAEEVEPLLASELYDTFRQSQQDRVSESLDAADRSLRQGFVEDAQFQQRRAASGVRQLREGVDRAAERVLGDETEALRRAERELRQLSGELQEELRTAETPGEETQARSSQPGETPAPGEPPVSPSQPNRSEQADGRGQRQNPAGDSPPDGRGARSPLERPASQRDADARPAPLGGSDFLNWSDRLRDVEEMIADPDLRAEAARIRDRARAIRKDSRRRSAPPNWKLVRDQVAAPLVLLQEQVRNELLRRSDDAARVPIDRDPVPEKYRDAVRTYYQRLGTGR